MYNPNKIITRRGIDACLATIADTDNQALMHRAICDRIREISPDLSGVHYIYESAESLANELEADAEQARDILINRARISGLSDYLSEKINNA